MTLKTRRRRITYFYIFAESRGSIKSCFDVDPGCPDKKPDETRITTLVSRGLLPAAMDQTFNHNHEDWLVSTTRAVAFILHLSRFANWEEDAIPGAMCRLTTIYTRTREGISSQPLNEMAPSSDC
jgi:hypothetical protein